MSTPEEFYRNGTKINNYKSSCCGVEVYGFMGSPIDTAYTMFCKRCLKRDRAVENKTKEERSGRTSNRT